MKRCLIVVAVVLCFCSSAFAFKLNAGWEFPGFFTYDETEKVGGSAGGFRWMAPYSLSDAGNGYEFLDAGIGAVQSKNFNEPFYYFPDYPAYNFIDIYNLGLVDGFYAEFNGTAIPFSYQAMPTYLPEPIAFGTSHYGLWGRNGNYGHYIAWGLPRNLFKSTGNELIVYFLFDNDVYTSMTITFDWNFPAIPPVNPGHEGSNPYLRSTPRPFDAGIGGENIGYSSNVEVGPVIEGNNPDILSKFKEIVVE